MFLKKKERLSMWIVFYVEIYASKVVFIESVVHQEPTYWMKFGMFECGATWKAQNNAMKLFDVMSMQNMNRYIVFDVMCFLYVNI